MNRITWDEPSGVWGINGINVKDVPGPLYGAMSKLRDYEKTGLDPEDVSKVDKLYRQKCEEVSNLEKERDSLKEQLFTKYTGGAR